jgi:biopolymer transport protein TolR
MKKSYKAVRMERHHKRGGNGSGLNLVSLMDIFTILVFFLLVNSSSVQQLPSSKAVKLPTSSAQQLPEETVILLVNNDQILVQGRLIAKVSDVIDVEGNLIKPLLEEMKLQALASFTPKSEEEGLDVTIMGDKQIPYKLLRKILATLSESNYTNISMAVMKKSDSQANTTES